MKSIIIYSTKHGSVEHAANILKSKMNGDVLLVNVMKETVPPVDAYDNVILAGSIYMGRIQKELTNYVTANLPVLLQKRVGLFICAASPEPAARMKELETSFPGELCAKAVCKDVFGYDLNYDKLNFFEKLIMRMVTGSKESSSHLEHEKIASFAKAISES